MRNQCDALSLTSELKDAAAQSRTWPFEEARKIIKRYEKTGYPDSVIFETGYGPSGLPHIGTFGEVARTTMVRHAFHVLTENKVKTKLLCFSDDMDGLRKVPENVPDRERMEHYLGQPLSRVPDPLEMIILLLERRITHVYGLFLIVLVLIMNLQVRRIITVPVVLMKHF